MTRPLALGYVCGGTNATVEQCELVTDHATAEGLALVDILDDRRDALTISEVVNLARRHDAQVVLVPSGARLAGAYTRLAYELEQHNVRCVLLGEQRPAARPGRVTNLPRRYAKARAAS